jgi:hypothetical protein
MESEFYAKDGSGDVESGDGGKWPYAYETGTAPEKLSPGETSDIYYLSE